MSVPNFPKKVFVELDYDDYEDPYLYFHDFNQASAGKQIATYELISVKQSVVKLVAIKPEETL